MRVLPRLMMKLLLVVCTAMLLSVMVAAAEGTSGKVTADALHIRSGPSTETEILGKFYNGAVVELTGEEGDWYTISYNGATAYLHKDYIQLVDEAAEDAAETYSMESHELKASVVDEACTHIGAPYVYGGASPSGFDCSGFTSSSATPSPAPPATSWTAGSAWSGTLCRWATWCSSGTPASPPRRPATWESISAAGSLSTPPPAAPDM